MALRSYLVSCLLLGASSQGGPPLCFSDGIQTSARQSLESGALPFPVGLTAADGSPSAQVMSHVAKILIQEKLGFHTNLSTTGGSSESYRAISDPLQKLHIALEIWEWADLTATSIDHVPERVGSPGYVGRDGIFVKESLWQGKLDASDQFRYQTIRTDQADFDNLMAVDPNLLQPCNLVDDLHAVEMYLYTTFDYDGTVMSTTHPGMYTRFCSDGKWWRAPACRGTSGSCIPLITFDNWTLTEFMTKAFVWNLPIGIASASSWASYKSIPDQVRGLFYWWTPDTSFLHLNPREVQFPLHNTMQWDMGNQSTMRADEPIGKYISSDLASLAPEVHFLVQFLRMDLALLNPIMQDAELQGARVAACNWLLSHQSVWETWLPMTSTWPASSSFTVTSTVMSSATRSVTTTQPSTAEPSTAEPTTTSASQTDGTTLASASASNPQVTSLVVGTVDANVFTDVASAVSLVPTDVVTRVTEQAETGMARWVFGLPTVWNSAEAYVDLSGQEGGIMLPAALLQRVSQPGLVVTQIADGSFADRLPAAAKPGTSVQNTSLQVSEIIIDVTFMELSTAASQAVPSLPTPIYIRMSTVSSSYSGESICAYLTADAIWSQDGVYTPSVEELATAGLADTSGMWCASTHLSLFAILNAPAAVAAIDCSFTELLDPSNTECFAIHILLAISALPLCFLGCCCAIFCCCFRCRRVTAGKLKLNDQKGGACEFNFKVAKEVTTTAIGGIAEHDSAGATTQTKIFVKWDVDLEQAARSNFEFEKSGSGAALQVTGKGMLLTHDDDAKSVKSLKSGQEESPRSARHRKLTEAEDEVERELSMAEGEAPEEEWTSDVFNVDVDDDTLTLGIRRTKSAIGYEAYAQSMHVEYFSETHQKWLQGFIESVGDVRAGETFPTYTILLKGGLHKQRREFVGMNLLREAIRTNQAVSVKVGEEWLPGVVTQRHALPLGYSVTLDSGKPMKVDAERVRPRFSNGQAVEVYRGTVLGWFPGVVKEDGWPQLAVEMTTHWEADELEISNCWHYHVRFMPPKQLSTKVVGEL